MQYFSQKNNNIIYKTIITYFEWKWICAVESVNNYVTIENISYEYELNMIVYFEVTDNR